MWHEDLTELLLMHLCDITTIFQRKIIVRFTDYDTDSMQSVQITCNLIHTM